MKNTVFVLWVAGVKPELLSMVPSLESMASAGVDLQLAPLPLAEPQLCYYQTLTGVNSGKIGRFDGVRPQGYQALEESGVPEGVLGKLLPDVVRARKLSTIYVETLNQEEPCALIEKGYDCTYVRLLAQEKADLAALDNVVRSFYELASSWPGAHVFVLTDVYHPQPHTWVNVNDFLADVGLLEVGQTRRRESIIWSETLAYGLGNGQIWLNLRGREPQGIVNSGKEYQEVRDALINELSTTWLDPETGQPIVERVLPKEHAYNGDYLFKAPDLTVVYNPGYAPSLEAAALDFNGTSIHKLATHSTLAHAPYARMIACGPCLKQGIKGTAQLVDVLPILLYTLGQSIPMYVDGNVILPMFADDYRLHTQVKRVQDEDLLSEEEEGLIVDRLRDLGYLG